MKFNFTVNQNLIFTALKNSNLLFFTIKFLIILLASFLHFFHFNNLVRLFCFENKFRYFSHEVNGNSQIL